MALPMYTNNKILSNGTLNEGQNVKKFNINSFFYSDLFAIKTACRSAIAEAPNIDPFSDNENGEVSIIIIHKKAIFSNEILQHMRFYDKIIYETIINCTFNV